MSETEIKVVQFPPSRVASFHGFGEGPELQALEKMKAWSEARGYYHDRKAHRVLGFDNPPPSPGSPNYGYEVWVTVSDDEPAAEGVEFKDFDGGLYAVLRTDVRDPWQDIPKAWETLVRWQESSKYHMGSHQCFEEHLDIPSVHPGGFVLEQCLPIVE